MSALGGDARVALLRMARASIREAFDGREAPTPEPMLPGLEETRGAFVTIKLDGNLRGCIGHIVSDRPLWETVSLMARAAAFEDPRFPPLERNDLDDVTLEVSVLTVPARVENPDDIRVGRDGLIVERGATRGLLLPQVATEWGWDRETFLDQTCIKAGLSAGAWRDPGTRVLAFSAEVFGE